MNRNATGNRAPRASIERTGRFGYLSLRILRDVYRSGGLQYRPRDHAMPIDDMMDDTIQPSSTAAIRHRLTVAMPPWS
jgi:hypothetical protein